MAWEIDAAHSHVQFAVRQTTAKPIRGRFTTVKGYLYADEGNLMHSWVDIQVDAASIDTGNEQRDAYLRSDAFLDVTTYPFITFQSTRLDHIDGNAFKLSGDLTWHGVTRDVTFSVKLDEHTSMRETHRATMTASTTLRCADFGLTTQGLAERLEPDDVAIVYLDLTLVSHSAVYHSLPTVAQR